MKLLATPWALLAVVVGIAFVGMTGAIDNVHNPSAAALTLGLMALAYVGIGIGELRVGQSRAQAKAEGALKESMQERSAQLDRELADIADLIDAHLASTGRYSESLAEAGRNLHAMANGENVRAVVRALIEANEQMQRETAELIRNLEISSAQVAAFRFKLAAAKAIGLRDSLTSLGNRRSFDRHLVKEIAEARAQGTEMCLVMGDLDHFKKINDNFGHPFGDRVLKYFADLLVKHIKNSDIAARLGGEEFAVILPQTSLENATLVVDRIRARLEAQQWKNAKSGELFSKITASFGIVRLGESDDSETLLKRADTMLYEAKRAGRNRIIIDQAA
jgi:diguanylate cyclase